MPLAFRIAGRAALQRWHRRARKQVALRLADNFARLKPLQHVFTAWVAYHRTAAALRARLDAMHVAWALRWRALCWKAWREYTIEGLAALLPRFACTLAL